ncbi:hypothetical protein CXF85_21250 [Colwellia sp. 75C3]|nr:hypothetical protein CXF85_21250 [Colwellia sp. 75C3]
MFLLFKTPKFVNSLKQLLSKNSSSYIFIEEPFGKERDVMSTLNRLRYFVRPTVGIMFKSYYNKAH